MIHRARENRTLTFARHVELANEEALDFRGGEKRVYARVPLRERGTHR